MSKIKEFSTEDQRDDKKKSKAVIVGWLICKYPMCCEKIVFNDLQDPDLELAKHRKARHDIAYPEWVSIVWDHKPNPKYRTKSANKQYEKKQNWKKT